MSLTVNDVLLGAYYRRGENSVPNDNNEKSRAISYVGDGFRDLVRKNKFWFHTKTYAFQSVDGKDVFDLNSDFREAIEVRYNGYLVFPQSQTTASNIYKYPPVYSPYPLNSLSERWYYINGDEIVFIPKFTETPTSYSITSVSVSGTVATVTTSSDHGFSLDYYVEIEGCTQSELNGSKRITSVPSSTTFTFTVASGTSNETPALATATRNNIEVKQYYWPTVTFSDVTDTIDLPEQYQDALSAYVYGRLAQTEGERGDASDGFTEYNDIVKQINQENFNRQLVQSSQNGLYN